MTDRHNDAPHLVIADGDPTFADAAADAILDADTQPTVETVFSGEEVLECATDREGSLDGIIVGDALERSLAIVEQLDGSTDVPIIFITDQIDDRNTVVTAVNAGADDYFPRITAVAQYKRIVDILTVDSQTDTTHVRASDSARTATESSSDSYREVFENVTDGLVVQDPETGEILDVNGQFCEMHGYTQDELVGEPIGIVTPPEAEYGYESAIELVDQAREGEPQLFEWRNQRNDGQTFPVEVHLTVVELNGEERVLASVRDITKRKRREREYEQIFHGVHDVITVHDPATGELLDMNDSLPDLLGYDREDLFELGIDGVSLQGAPKESSREFIHEVMESAESVQIEWAVETSDSETRWLEVKGTMAEIGSEQRYLAIGRDITEQRQSERRFRTISERIEEIIYLTNADLSNVYYVNSAYADIFGRPVNELYEDSEAYFDAVLPEDRDSFRAHVDAMVEDIDSGDPDDRYEFAYRIQRPDGEIRSLETTGYPVLTEPAEPHQYVSITEDVTDRQTREQRLTVLNRILRHNVRNTLDVVLAHADQIDNETVQTRVRESATDLLELSRKAREAEEVMQASTEPPETVDVTEIAQTVVDEFRTGDYSGDILLDSPEELLIPSHQTVVQRVISELVENSLTHTDEDTPRVEISVREDTEAAVKISIADYGPGLPAQEQQVLAAGTETQLKHSQGIGLWFVNWAVTQLGGDLQFQQNDPEGSIVTISLYDVASDREITN